MPTTQKVRQQNIQVIKNTFEPDISTKLIEFIRYTNEQTMREEEVLKYLKAHLERHFDSKWQVIIGDCMAYFDDDMFPHFLELYTRGFKILIFRKLPLALQLKRQQLKAQLLQTSQLHI